MDKIEAILDKIPHYYNKDTSSKIYNILKSFADEFEITGAQYIDRADNDIGIITTVADDLDWRWGKFLGVKRKINEPDDSYRLRLVNTINSLHGGTAEAIRYAVALILGISDNDERMDRQIKIYDAWNFDAAPNKEYGNFVVYIRFDGNMDYSDIYYDGIEDDIADIVDGVKAAGTNCAVIFGCTVHNAIGVYHHHQLLQLTHDDIRWKLTSMVLEHNNLEGLYDCNGRALLDADGVKLFTAPISTE